MSRLIFFRETAAIAKAAEPKIEANLSSIVVVGVIILALLSLAIILYAMGQSDGGRAIIDLALLFFGWATGRATGEKAGLGRKNK